MGGAVVLEALPIVGQLPRERDLPSEQRLGLIGSGGLRPLEGGPLGRVQIGVKRGAQVNEQGPGCLLELLSVLCVRGVGSRPSMVAPKLDHQLERGHLQRFPDAVAELRVNALHQATGVSVLMTERAAGRSLAHAASSMRARPRARGSGVMPKSLKKRAASATLSSSSIVIWSIVTG